MLLCADLANIGLPMACASLGMLRGGGIAHATFATAARNHPQVEAIYRWGWKLAFGAAPPQELLQCWDAVLQTRDNGKFHGNRTHTDAKGDYSLQCEIVLWPLGWWRRTTFAPHGRHHGIQRSHPEHSNKLVVELRMSAYHDGKL